MAMAEYKTSISVDMGGSDKNCWRMPYFKVVVYFSKLASGRIFIRSIKDSTGIEFIGSVETAEVDRILDEISERF
jgi:hypothetical protein